MSVSHSPHVPQAHRGNQGLIPAEIAVAALLIVIGLTAALAYAVPEVALYGALIVGITCLALFALTREYGFAVPAGIVTGIGVGIALVDVVPPDSVPSTIMLSLAGGFVGAWLLGLVAVPPMRIPWALIPASIIGAVGLLLAAGLEGAMVYSNLVAGGVLVLVGVLLVVRYLRTAR